MLDIEVIQMFAFASVIAFFFYAFVALVRSFFKN